MQFEISKIEEFKELDEKPSYKIGDLDSFQRGEIDFNFPFYKSIPELLRQTLIDIKEDFDSLKEGEELFFERNLKYTITIKK